MKSKEIGSFLKGRYFNLMIRRIIGLNKYKLNYEIRKFGPGCYTLLNDKEKEEPGVDFAIDFSKSNNLIGGYTAYLTESKELLTLNPMPNTLSFVDRKESIMKYIKYLTHQNKLPVVQVAGVIYGR